MSDETDLVAPMVNGPLEVVVPEAVEAALPGQEVTTPSQEQVRAAEAAFTRQDESSAVAGLLGMWTGTLLLHDLAVEHFSGPADEEEEKEPRKKKKKEDRSHP